MQSILALDLGTRTGWAVRTRGGTVGSGVLNLKGSRFEGRGMRFLRLHGNLVEMSAAFGGFDRIAFEEVRNHKGIDAAHIYGGLLGILTSWAEEQAIPYSGVPVSTIKQHATGKGNAGKDAVIAAMRARGFDPEDDNEADALAILCWATANEASDAGPQRKERRHPTGAALPGGAV